jgi:acetyl-CoA carboxylase, biotin carboxylase subunit
MSPRSVLVLGKRGVAELVAERLEQIGLAPELQYRHPALAVLSPAHPQGAASLREALADFRARQPDGFIHPGVSEWSDRVELPTVGQELGLPVVCPPAKVLSLFANRLTLVAEAEHLGIPNLLIAPDPIHTVREIEKLLRGQKQRFPFVLKAVRGGKGLGLQVVYEPEDLVKKLPLWFEQLRGNLGEVILMAERYLEGGRYISIPFARLPDGTTRVFPSVDASLQCRFRKVIEFCPATGLDAEVEAQLAKWTGELAARCGYIGVGCLEFLVDGTRAYLMEGLARLNSGFHLWEQVAGTNAVAWQMAAMQMASGPDLPEVKPAPDRAHGLALRVFAEDSLLQLPQPGRLREASERRHWRFPGAEARLSHAFEAGEEVRAEDRGLLTTLWVTADAREKAVMVARGVLDELWIAGSLQTNERFMAELLAHPWVKEGVFHAGFVDEEFIPAVRPPPDLVGTFAAICADIADPGDVPARWAVGDQWVKLPDEEDRAFQVAERWNVADGAGKPRVGSSGTVALPEGGTARFSAYPLRATDAAGGEGGRWQVRVGRWALPVKRVLGTADRRKPKPRVLAIIPGRVHSILFREGAVVPPHEPFIIVESLGMLVPHALPVEVRIQRWKVGPEERVQAGQELADFEVLSKP